MANNDTNNKWLEEVYSEFWLNRVEHYGFDHYCKWMVNKILGHAPNKVYELGIGTGWPFASTLSENGIEVCGTDIAKLLVEKVRTNYPQIKAFVSSEFNYQNYINTFDFTYCIRSSWYFKDFIAEIDNLYSITTVGGHVLFDIMNSDSKITKRQRMISNIKIPYRWVRKVINSILFNNNKMTVKYFEYPLSCNKLDEYLTKNNYNYMKYYFNQIDNIFSDKCLKGINDQKIIYLIQK